YVSLLVSMEVGAPFPDDPGAAELAILERWRSDASEQLPIEFQPPPWPQVAPGARIGAALATWARAALRPLVLFLDRIDAVRDAALISVLRQLRSGYASRPRAFPWSLALVGRCDLHDYKIKPQEGDLFGPSSHFNIKADSLTLRAFTRDEVAELC